VILERESPLWRCKVLAKKPLRSIGGILKGRPKSVKKNTKSGEGIQKKSFMTTLFREPQKKKWIKP